MKRGSIVLTAVLITIVSVFLGNEVYAFTEQRKFVGQEYDPATDLNYLNARYYNSKIGRFTSEDPMFWNFDQAWLTDPQNQNSYAYARNNPIVGSDPSGLLTVVIPGTFYDANAWNSKGSMSSFLSSVQNTFQDKMIVENNKSVWSGQDNDAARKSAATAIAQQINDYNFTDGEKLNIVGHSHGGNVANLITGEISHKVDNLVTLGTPVIGGYSVDRGNVKNQVNVYSWFDPFQKGGGNQLTTSGVAGYVAGGLLAGPVGSLIGGLAGNSLGWGQFGIAERSVSGASNINVTPQTLFNHGAYLSNPKIWSKVDKVVNK